MARTTEPASDYFAITPSDTVDFTVATNKTTIVRGIYVGTGGNIAAVRQDGTAVTFTAVPVGVILPIVAKRVNSTNTTASNLVGLY